AGGTRGGAAAAAGPVWPDGAPGPGMVEALQALLGQEHRAGWSYAVVQAWAGDREDDAGAARAAATRRSERLAAVLEQLGVQPVGPAATYPTDDAGSPVDGPVTAAALALRLDDAVATAAAGVLAVAVGVPPSDAWGAWVRAAVHGLADAERSRWSWGGAPAPLPGG
ncbi:DUF4439 domain-containing protein, partial [Aquipuribacter hungaricus]